MRHLLSWTLAFFAKTRFYSIEMGSGSLNPVSLACSWQSSPTKGPKRWGFQGTLSHLPKIRQTPVLSCLVLIILLLTASNCGPRKYTIDDVTQVLYEAGLLPTRHLTMTADPEVIKRTSGIETYPFTIEDPHLSRAYYADIMIFPSQRSRERFQQKYAEISESLGTTRDIFVKGNVMLMVVPVLPEAEAEKYRQALESLN